MDRLLQQQGSILNPSPFSDARRDTILEHENTMRRSTNFSKDEQPLQISMIQRNSKISTSMNNQQSRVSNQFAFQNQDSLNRFSLTRSSILQVNGQPKLRTREWDVKNEYSSLSPFFASLLDDRENYENFVNGQQQVHLNNDIDNEIMSYIMRKPQKARFEIDYIKRALKQIDIFSDSIDLITSKDAENRLFLQLNIEFFPPNTEIFSYNEFGENFYVVLKGKVACLTPNQDKNNTQSTPSEKDAPMKTPSKQPQAKRRDSTIKGQNMFTFKYDTQNSQKFTIADLYPDMNLIKSYKQGEYFGEISLLTKQKRTASMVAEDDVQLLTISKKGFNQLLGTKQQQILKEKMRFLKQFAFFEILSNARLLSLLHDIKEVTYPGNGTVIYKEDDPVDSLYLIKSGQVEISYKKVTNSSYQDTLLNQFKTPRSIKQQRVPLIIKGPNTYFGEEDFLLNSTKRTKCAQVVSEEAVLMIVNFRNLMINLKFFGGQVILADMFNIKSSWECKRILDIEETKTKCAKHKIFHKLKKKKMNNNEDQKNRSTIEFNTTNRNDSPDFNLEKSPNSQRDPLSTKRSSLFRHAESQNLLPQFSQTLSKQFSSCNNNHKFLSNNTSGSKGLQIFMNEEQQKVDTPQNSMKMSINSFEKANNPFYFKLTHQKCISHSQQPQSTDAKTINLNTNSSEVEQQDNNPIQEKAKLEKSTHYFSQNTLSQNKTKKQIPILNLDGKRLSTPQQYSLPIQELDQRRTSNQFFSSTPGKNQAVTLMSVTSRGNQSERNTLNNYFTNRKLSCDITQKNISLTQGIKSSLNSKSFLNHFSEYTAKQGNNDKLTITKSQSEENKLDLQQEAVSMLRSNFVNDARDLVKQKKSFLNILKKRKKQGNVDTFKNDYFEIPQSLLKKCISSKQVLYREFKQVSYFYPNNFDPQKQVETKPEGSPSHYNKVLRNLMKFVKNSPPTQLKDEQKS